MSFTLLIVLITSGLSIFAWNNHSLLSKWIFNPYTVFHNREYHRFVTSGMIHANWTHLLFNMFVLYMFGKQVEEIFIQVYGETGLVIFGLLYILGIVVSDIPTFLKNKDNPHYNALGASGGTAAIMFSYILFYPSDKLYLYAIIGLPGVLWGALYIVYSVYAGKRQADNINHDAHLWGSLFGVVFTILVYPKVIGIFIEGLKHFSIF
jgi:membrane associated rhomboid family serine protease